MIHQPLGGTSRRQASDIEIEAREILRMKEMLNRSLADMSGQSFEKIEKDTDRDYCLLYTSPSPRDATLSRMPSSA